MSVSRFETVDHSLDLHALFGELEDWMSDGEEVTGKILGVDAQEVSEILTNRRAQERQYEVENENFQNDCNAKLKQLGKYNKERLDFVTEAWEASESQLLARLERVKKLNQEKSEELEEMIKEHADLKRQLDEERDLAFQCASMLGSDK